MHGTVPLGTLYAIRAIFVLLHADRAEPEANRNNYILLQTVQHRAALQVSVIIKTGQGVRAK